MSTVSLPGACHAKKWTETFFQKAEVAEFLNHKFIAVKVQMDKTTLDDDIVKQWYEEAQKCKSNMLLMHFPLILFFSPDGIVLHKTVGVLPVEKFIEEAKNALDPEKQYYTLLNKLKPAELDTATLKKLALEYKSAGKELSQTLAAAYLSKIPSSQLGRTDVLNFMIQFRDAPVVQRLAASYIKGVCRSVAIQIRLIKYFWNIFWEPMR